MLSCCRTPDWSLLSHPEWRERSGNFAARENEHNAWKTLLEDIFHGELLLDFNVRILSMLSCSVALDVCGVYCVSDAVDLFLF